MRVAQVSEQVCSVLWYYLIPCAVIRRCSYEENIEDSFGSASGGHCFRRRFSVRLVLLGLGESGTCEAVGGK